jgi:hypothetical protein
MTASPIHSRLPALGAPTAVTLSVLSFFEYPSAFYYISYLGGTDPRWVRSDVSVR